MIPNDTEEFRCLLLLEVWFLFQAEEETLWKQNVSIL
jgi:hypothetical protein